MAGSEIGAQVVLIITAAALCYAALTDLREYKIRNELIYLLVGLFFVHCVLTGRWSGIYWNVALALIVFLSTLWFYSRRMIGGGDVKIVTVAFLWVGIDYALALALLTLAFSALHAVLAKIGWMRAEYAAGHLRIPFAPSVAAALIGCFVLELYRF